MRVVPARPEKLDEDCYEAFNIQVDALMRRIQSTGAKSLVIGISGGLDSTHALIVAAKACDRLGLPRRRCWKTSATLSRAASRCMT